MRFKSNGDMSPAGKKDARGAKPREEDPETKARIECSGRGRISVKWATDWRLQWRLLIPPVNIVAI